MNRTALMCQNRILAKTTVLLAKSVNNHFLENSLIEEFLKCAITAGGCIDAACSDFTGRISERLNIALNELNKAAFIVRMLIGIVSVDVVLSEKFLSQSSELLDMISKGINENIKKKSTSMPELGY